jgi:hypothetical protein
MSPSRREIVEKRREKEQQELSNGKALSAEELLGRQSGSTEWKSSRGELGNPTVIIPKTVNWTSKNKKVLFQDFSDIKLIGSAKSQSDRIRITEAQNDQTGAFWFKKKVSLGDQEVNSNGDGKSEKPLSSEGFELNFSFQVKINQNSTGADGFAFVIQDQSDNAIGTGGCNLGFAGITKW